MLNMPPPAHVVDPTPSGITYFHPLARPLFERALWQGKFRDSIAHLIGRSRVLDSMENSFGKTPETLYRNSQVIAVPLANIKGTLNRQSDFDCEFYPLSERLEERWVRIASMMLQGALMPPVELIQKGDIYYVADGHHRVSVARARKQITIDAVIVGSYGE
jgi:hypothetical protein